MTACQQCYKRVGSRTMPCMFCEGVDCERKQPPEAPSIGCVPVTIYLPPESVMALRLRASLSALTLSETVSDLVKASLRAA
jgi:hypothetical protein